MVTNGKFVSYLRVSTDRQGRSGLGLGAQRKAVDDFLNGGRWKSIAEYVEVESGKDNDRPKLKEALHRAKVTGATLVIAKLDRLSRNVGFIAQLRDSGAKFVCADMPDATDLTINIFAALAEHERKVISARTKDAMRAKIEMAKQEAKRQRRRYQSPFGNPHGATGLRGLGNGAAVEAIKAKADRHAQDVLPIIRDIEASGVTSLHGIAAELNARGILTARSGRWYAMTVRNLLRRLGAGLPFVVVGTRLS